MPVFLGILAFVAFAFGALAMAGMLTSGRSPTDTSIMAVVLCLGFGGVLSSLAWGCRWLANHQRVCWPAHRETYHGSGQYEQVRKSA
jgi:hypothetical protein